MIFILKTFFLGGVHVEPSDTRCTHLVIEDGVTELPSGLIDQTHCQVVRQEVSKYIYVCSLNLQLSPRKTLEKISKN